MLGQLKERHVAKEKRIDDFNKQALMLQEEQQARAAELERAQKATHEEKQRSLWKGSKRAERKAKELREGDATVDEISGELQALNELDLEDLAELQKGLQQDLTAEVSRQLEEEKSSFETLLRKDATVAAIEDTDRVPCGSYWISTSWTGRTWRNRWRRSARTRKMRCGLAWTQKEESTRRETVGVGRRGCRRHGRD